MVAECLRRRTNPVSNGDTRKMASWHGGSASSFIHDGARLSDVRRGVAPVSIAAHAVSAVAAIAFWTAMTLGYGAYMPVVIGERAVMTNVEPGSVSMRIAAYKIRDCRYVPDSQLGYVKIKGSALWYESDFEFVNDRSPNSSRPGRLSEQDFGVWRWRVVGEGPAPEITETFATVNHDCSSVLEGAPDANRKLTKLGPFEID